MPQQKQPVDAPASNDDATAMRADQRVDYSAIVDRKPLPGFFFI